MSRGGTGSATSIYRIDGTRIWSGRPDLFAGALALTLLAAALALFAHTEPSTLVHGAGSEAQQAYGKLPLSFAPNRGQTDPQVRYYAQGPGYSFYFTPHKAVIALTKGKRGHALELRFLGANPHARLEATKRQSGTVSYFQGQERHTGIPTYRQVEYRDLWPGIDMLFKSREGKLEYEFLVRPGADPRKIRLAYAGADGLSLKAGALLIRTPLGVLSDTRPRSFQRVGEQRAPVDSSYALTGDTRYRFNLGPYDHRRPLVIDPGLAYSTFLGGSNGEIGRAIAVDELGNAYVTGETSSPNFPTTPGAYDRSFSESSTVGTDVFVAKLNADGSALVYATYLGGPGGETYYPGEAAFDIAVDANGSVYLTGDTDNTNFPTTPGAYDRTHGESEWPDAFVAKLTADGSDLAYSTYLEPGFGWDIGTGIAVDAEGNAYVTGLTGLTDSGEGTAFVTKLNASGSALLYSTLFGGLQHSSGGDIFVDGQGSAYVTGYALSSDFPTTPGAYDTTFNGGQRDVFVTKLDPSGSGFLYSTYLGGNGEEFGNAIVVDGQGSAYVTGYALSSDFPTTPGAYDTTFNGGNDFGDAFVTKLNPTGTELAYSTYLGGTSDDSASDLDADERGNAYVTGLTRSSDFPATPDSHDPTISGDFDAFTTKLNTLGNALAYSTYLGGSRRDAGEGIVVRGRGAYVTGVTGSGEFPTTTGVVATTLSGSSDAFVTKLDIGLVTGPPANLTLSPKTATNTVDSQHCVTATVTDASDTPTPEIAVVFTITATNRAGGTRTTNTSGQATFCYTGELFGTDQIAAFADSSPENGSQDPGEPADSATKQWLLPAQSCRASITNSGRMVAQNGDSAIFRGQAMSNPSGVRGSELYLDRGPAQRLTLRSLELLAITCDPDQNRATIFGRAAIDGSGSFAFRIDLQDNGDPGAGRDTYRILIESGYDSGEQVLRSGNVRLWLR